MDITIAIASAAIGIALGLLITYGRLVPRSLAIEFVEEKIRPYEEAKDKSHCVHVWHAAPAGSPPRVYIGWMESATYSEDMGKARMTYPFSVAGAKDLASLLEQAANGEGEAA